MGKSILFIILLISIVINSGCIGSQGTGANTPSGEKMELVPVRSLEDIATSLEKGATLVMIGYDSCPACKSMKPVLEEIAAEYDGRASVMYIDTTKVGTLGFGVYYVPDSFVMVDIENGTYLYMRGDGQTTTNREEARFVGLTRKTVLTQTLDMALEERSKDPQHT